MTHIPAARRYRPQCFSEVLGQDTVVTILQRALYYDRVPSAVLFVGPRGTGKTTLARLFAKTLNCETLAAQRGGDNDRVEPCNRCPSCLAITASRADEVLEIDAASHGGVDDIKTLEGLAMLATPAGTYRIVILDECQQLTTAAQNALLVLLENPPPRFLILFCTTNPEKILATIKSRCSINHIKPIHDDGVTANLTRIFTDAGQPITAEALFAIVQSSQGSLRDVQQVADQIISLACGAEVDEVFLEDAVGIATTRLYREVAGALSEGWLGGPQPWFLAVQRWAEAGIDLKLLFNTVIVNFIRDVRISMCFVDQPECGVRYYSGIPHSTFVERGGTFTERCLDILLEAWDEMSEHNGMAGLFDRAILELWFLKAWNVRRYEAGYPDTAATEDSMPAV